MKRTIHTARAYAMALALATTISMMSCQTQDNSDEPALKDGQEQTIITAQSADITRAVVFFPEEELVDIVNYVLNTDYDAISGETKLSWDLLADEKDMAQIFSEINFRLAVNIPWVEQENIETFGDLVNYVKKHFNGSYNNPDIIFSKVQRIISEQSNISISQIYLHSNLKRDLGMDSLDVFETAMAIEEEFAIEIPDEYIERIKIVEDYILYLRHR
ncbi:acyl carrier protein [Alistipes timonensis]|uniref:acyl carrier protein n=1 Tax=Alistipes timonensis TaxID=1465754 RepID=UPI001C3CA4A5|nr:acyl carrier protein [Alistipes timonensis]MCR2030126.1 acyl carrier protein [Alistipes timonensis]